MKILFAILFGIILKIYDEIIDLNIKINPLYIECLKSLDIMFFTLLGYNDFSFSLWTFIIGLLTYGADDNHWKTFILISFILCIISFKSLESIWFLFIIIVISILFLNIEHKLIPEESSTRKLISRIIFLIIGIIILLIIPHFEIWSDYNILTEKTVGLGIGASIISIISQSYSLYFDNNKSKKIK
jgi:hypothetical protein